MPMMRSPLSTALADQAANRNPEWLNLTAEDQLALEALDEGRRPRSLNQQATDLANAVLYSSFSGLMGQPRSAPPREGPTAAPLWDPFREEETEAALLDKLGPFGEALALGGLAVGSVAARRKLMAKFGSKVGPTIRRTGAGVRRKFREIFKGKGGKKAPPLRPSTPPPGGPPGGEAAAPVKKSLLKKLAFWGIPIGLAGPWVAEMTTEQGLSIAERFKKFKDPNYLDREERRQTRDWQRQLDLQKYMLDYNAYLEEKKALWEEGRDAKTRQIRLLEQMAEREDMQKLQDLEFVMGMIDRYNEATRGYLQGMSDLLAP